MFSSYDGLCSIGELAEHAGVTVKTVRFYSERGLLPAAARSPGGHRRYAPGALDRLRLIRSLRTLDLPVREVHRILDEAEAEAEGQAEGQAEAGTEVQTAEARSGASGTGSTSGAHSTSSASGPGSALEDALAEQLRALGTQLKALRWREAGLRLVQECPPGERADRLRLVGAVTAPPTTDSLARFWRGWLPARMPAGAASAFLEVAVPQPPDDPQPAQVLAFARLHAFATSPCTGAERPQPAAHRAAGARGAAVLYAALAEAYELAGTQMQLHRTPYAGEALDSFVDAYASAYGSRDTPDFRRGLAAQLAADPRIDWYWELASQVVTPPGARPAPTPGAAHDWLCTALEAQTATARR